MLTAPSLHRRLASRLCAISDARPHRCYSRRQDRWTVARSQNVIGRGKTADEARNDAPNSEQRKRGSNTEVEQQEANLYEQLFGPLNQEKEQSGVSERDVPPIPLEAPMHQDRPRSSSRPSYSAYERQIKSEGDSGISVLVLRNASKNLVEEDFRRLIPQGSHLEGWTLEQGDIVKVIAGRDLTTLEQQNFYYLLFSSRLSAFSYQGHALRVHKIVASHTPSSILSPMMPPSGIMSKNMDAKTAIQSFSLVAPNQELDLRQLKPPLTPVMQAIVRNRGYPGFATRKHRMPFEARLTLEGPQLHEQAIRHFFLHDGIDRRLSWSGNNSSAPTVAKWIPAKTATIDGNRSPMERSREADNWGRRQKAAEQMAPDRATKPLGNFDVDNEKPNWVKPSDAFVVGFATQRAMQSFVQHWHRRPMETESFKLRKGLGADIPPIINVEPLW